MSNTKDIDVKPHSKPNGDAQSEGQMPLLSKWKKESSGDSATNLSLAGYVRLKSIERDIASMLRTAKTVDEVKERLGV